MIKIVANSIDTDQVLRSVESDLAGASILFLGTTRRFTEDRETVKLEYECYERMALHKMAQLRETAMTKWSIQGCAIVHRVGSVPVGESSVAIAVSSAHRADSFAAAQWLIDTLKNEVPIWKQENFSDGSQEWVHPNPHTKQEPIPYPDGGTSAR